MLGASALFRLLGDDVRLRILRLLESERLNVSELTAIVGIAQSGVSRHLGLLRDAGLVREHREGGFTYYGPTNEPGDRFTRVWPLVRSQLDGADGGSGDDGDALFRDDDTRLIEVKRQRREVRETHGAGRDGEGGQLVPGRSWAAWSRALGLLLPGWTVVDLGCGDGRLTLEIAVWARQVVGVDRSSEVLRHARARARRARVTNVTWKRGSLEEIPLDDASVDLAVLSQALHHAEDPARALTEAVRVVGGGGQVLVLDLDEHQERWVTERLGDRWLGFDRPALTAMMRKAGLDEVRVGTGLAGGPFGVVVAAGTRPAPG